MECRALPEQHHSAKSGATKLLLFPPPPPLTRGRGTAHPAATGLLDGTAVKGLRIQNLFVKFACGTPVL